MWIVIYRYKNKTKIEMFTLQFIFLKKMNARSVCQNGIKNLMLLKKELNIFGIQL